MTSPATLPAASDPTHGCVRCGRPVPIHVALCEECNPLGLKQPAATQVHAIAAGGIVLFVVVLAVLARVGLSGVGPFSGVVAGVEARDGGPGRDDRGLERGVEGGRNDLSRRGGGPARSAGPGRSSRRPPSRPGRR